ncbi:hypothetical protein WN73_21635 [Bradyrhizobium sp. CCBAU 45394]|nr:hypothetical protein [Bradyrhizobium sp. CCBAU 45394]
MEYEHLAGAVGPGSNADGRYCQVFGRSCGKLGWNTFQYQRETSGFLQMMRVVEQALGLIGRPPLHLESTHNIDALWGKTEMAHDGNVAVDESAHHFNAIATSLEFYRVGAPLKESSSVSDGFLGTYMETEKGHISYEQCAWFCARDRLKVMVHHRHTDRQRIVESEADVADAVPDKNDIHYVVCDARRNGVIGSGHRNSPPFLLPPLQ